MLVRDYVSRRNAVELCRGALEQGEISGSPRRLPAKSGPPWLPTVLGRDFGSPRGPIFIKFMGGTLEETMAWKNLDPLGVRRHASVGIEKPKKILDDMLRRERVFLVQFQIWGRIGSPKGHQSGEKKGFGKGTSR